MAAHCRSIVGVDISGKMVEYYNEIAKKEGLQDKISAIKADVISDPTPLGDKMFDVIVVRREFATEWCCANDTLFSVRFHTTTFRLQAI